MIESLRKKFVIVTMSLLVVVLGILFMVSNRYDRYWDEYDTYRIVKIISNNGYLKDYADEAVALTTIDSAQKVTIVANATELTNQEVKEVSLQLLKHGKKRWKFKDYVYKLKERKDGTWQLTFIDLASYSNSLEQTVMIIVFMVFGFALLTGVSIYLSRFVVKPAQNAIEREKQFVSDASHELKTPISAIRANAQVLQNQIEHNRYLDHILSETKRMEQLVQDLLGLARLDNNQAKKNFDKVNLSELSQEMLLTYESLAYEEGKLIEEQIQDGVYVVGQEKQLKQLLTILLDNAIRHSLDESTITLSLSQVKKRVILTLSNPSKIYPEDVMHNLFERFYQAEDSHHTTSSFGLGLAIAKAIVVKHKGQIFARQDGNIMTLQVILPGK